MDGLAGVIDELDVALLIEATEPIPATSAGFAGPDHAHGFDHTGALMTVDCRQITAPAAFGEDDVGVTDR